MEELLYEEAETCSCVEVHPDTLAAVKSGMPAREKLTDLSELFKMFADETRVRILFVLFEADVCVCDLAEALDMTPSAISHQLALLKRCKLVKSRREGRSIIYSLADDHVRTIIGQGMDHISE